MPPASRTRRLTALAAPLLLAAGLTLAMPAAAHADPEVTFSDDFSESSLSTANWQLTLGTSYPGGPAAFGTGEHETMTNSPDNVSVHDGALYITPTKDANGQWSSGRVESTRTDFKPPAGGTMTVTSRVQMPNVTGPEALGYWPAFWMLGSPNRANPATSWPGVGEFDIMENVQGLNWSYAVLHCGFWDATGNGPCDEPNGLNNAGTPCQVTTCQAGFHDYRLEWDDSRGAGNDQLRWSTDGTVTQTVNQADLPAQTWTNMSQHSGYFLIYDVAMGGAFPDSRNLGGGPTDTTKPGVPMIVDSVSVTYGGGDGTTTPPVTTPPTTVPPVVTPPVTEPPVVTPPVTEPPVTTPPAGSGLRATAVTTGSITLTWDAVPGATGYEVLRSGIVIPELSGTTSTSATNVGLLPNTPYIYSVRAVGGSATPEITVTTPAS